MPKDWPTNNAREAGEQTPALTEEEKKLEEKRVAIIKLKTEIVEEEERIALIPNEQRRDIEQNILNDKRGLLEIRINEYDKLKQKIRS